MGDSVLERNLCFVDTPGYSNKTSVRKTTSFSPALANISQCLECITPVVDYVESQYKRVSSFEGLGESEMVNLLSGNGGPQVDLVLYVILNRKLRPALLDGFR